MKSKHASILNKVVVHIILIGIIFAIFLMAIAGKVNGRDVKQQVLEKQIVLLIDSSEPGMDFEINKINVNGVVDNIEIKEGRIFVSVDGLSAYRGYPYFSMHSVDVRDDEGKFVVSVR